MNDRLLINLKNSLEAQDRMKETGDGLLLKGGGCGSEIHLNIKNHLSFLRCQTTLNAQWILFDDWACVFCKSLQWILKVTKVAK